MATCLRETPTKTRFKEHEMRNLAICLIVVVICATATAQNWTTSILGGTDSTAAVGIGRTFGGTAEFGLSIVTADESGFGLRTALGPYVGTQAKVPGLDAGDAVSFLGGAMLVDMDSSRPIFRGFAGLILNPQSQASPVVLYNYSYSTPESDVLPVDRSAVYAGLRIRF
jgi:hypothetical protein